MNRHGYECPTLSFLLAKVHFPTLKHNCIKKIVLYRPIKPRIAP
jgi:hypothetical protein